MKSKAIFLALLAFVFEAQARPVASAEAMRATTAWAKTGLSARVAARAATVHETEGGVIFYGVKTDGGTVFLSGDTERRPIIAFVPEAAVPEALDKSSPLWALLSRDQDAQAVLSAATAAGTASAAGSQTVSEAERAWAELLADDDEGIAETASKEVLSPAMASVSSLKDIRSGPLLQSTWNQSTVGKKNCYNYYTPKLSDGSRAVCGCVATAMSQVMRYHRYPTTEVKGLERTCYVEPSTKLKDKATVKLTMQGGFYDWANMPLKPLSVTDQQCQAIGKLTSDAGIAVYMGYDTEEQGGSGSFMFNVPRALTEVFGYASACLYRAKSAKSVSDEAAVMRNAMLSNFDTGYPVLMGIAGEGGHAIVGDGYGYKDGKLYVHLNMGWSGAYDVWYNLPDIVAGGHHFTVFSDLVYNIFPKAAGGLATLSGRVVDDEGNGYEGAQVVIRKAGATESVATDLTTNGVYGVRVSPGTYEVEAFSKDGTMSELQHEVQVKVPVTGTTSYSGWIVEGKWSETYDGIPVVMSAASVGNLQKTSEIVIFKPTVKVGESQYASLSKALTAARAQAAATPGETVEVEVIDDTELSESFVVDFSCALKSAESAKTVTRVKGARLDVAEGGCLEVSGLKFAGSSAKLFVVAANGYLAVGAGVDFGVPETAAAVETAQADGFTITGAPAESFMVDCTSARDEGNVFGFADCDFGTAQALAAKFVNLNDPDREMAGEAVEGDSAPYELKWSRLPVPLEDATAYYVVDGDPANTNCFRRLDSLFRNLETVDGVAEVTVVKNGPLSRKITLKNDLRLVSSTGVVISNLSSSAGFVIGEGKTLTVDGVSFDGYRGDALFLVDGGDLALGGNMAIRNVNGANALYSGAVSVLRGSAVIGSDSGDVIFEACRNDHQNSYGGAVYLDGEGCYLEMKGCTAITNCFAKKGGGIYVESGSEVALSGYLTIKGNTSSYGSDDICYWRATSDVSTLRLVGPVAKGSKVGILIRGAYASVLSQPGASFLTVDESFVDKNEILNSSAAFFSDDIPDLLAEPDDDYGTLRWYADDGSVKPVDPQAATTHVVLGDGSEGWYGSLEDAFRALTGDAVIELLSNAEMISDVTVAGSVVLRSGAGGPYAVTRVAQCQFTIAGGAALTIEDLTVDGRLDDERGGNGLLIEVAAGELTLGAGAVLCDVSGGDERASGAVKVYKGKVTMLEGSEIRDCVNSYVDLSSNNSRGGGITADSVSVVRLLGGMIDGCVANRGGAAFVGNGSTVEIGGNFTAIENADDPLAPNNVCVAATSELILISELTGKVGILPGVNADPYVFGTVASTFTGDASIANSAHNFRHDETDDIGIAVRNGGETLLVWSDGLDASGNFVKDGKTYTPVAGGDVIEVPVPDALEDLVYDATEQVGVDDGHGFVIVGDTAVDAGDYTATLTLKPGFKWDDGTTAEKEIVWTIDPAPLTVAAIACGKVQGEADPPLTYSVAGLQGKDLERDVLSGELVRTEGEDPGTYSILRGSLEVVNPNYALEYVGADFTISAPLPPPGPTIVTNTPDPIAFQSIERISALEWKLVVTNVKEKCEYCLTFTDDLKAGFITTGAWERATFTGAWTTNVIFSSENPKPAFFWKALGRETYDEITPSEK